MLIGEYKHTVDPKKRVSLPAKFRKELGGEVVLAKGFDNCLYVYSTAEWERVAGKLSQLSMGQSDTRNLNRFMFSGADLIEVDSLGRILISDFLKDYAGIKEKVVIIGVHSHVEVWNEDKWNEYKLKIDKQADSIAEKLGEVGVL